ncbi:MAG: hypothetical protein ACLQVJ_19250 [Syntrophobacteraceae bacterium]
MQNGNQKRQPETEIETAKRSDKKHEGVKGNAKSEVSINILDIERPAARAVSRKTDAEEMKVEKHCPKACHGPDPEISALLMGSFLKFCYEKGRLFIVLGVPRDGFSCHRTPTRV